jgi:gluconate 5-dehydrogenase
MKGSGSSMPNNLFDVSGKVIIVTGSSRGLGSYMAQGLAKADARIIVTARNLNKCREIADGIRKNGGQAAAIACDVTVPQDVARLAEETIREYGQIDVLINNAGMALAGSPHKMTLQDWNQVLAGNLTGTFLCSREISKTMIARKKGKIINIASLAAFRAFSNQYVNSVAYNASKGGVVALTIDSAAKWARYNINVNCISPGWFPSDMSIQILDDKKDALLEATPLGRFGQPKDLIAAAIFLASEASDFITGQNLVIDGGYTIFQN